MARWQFLRLLVLGAALVAAEDRLLAKDEGAMIRDRLWTWGYVIEGKAPQKVPFVGLSSCSLETAAGYIGSPNVVFMNSNHNRNTLAPQCLDRLASCKQVVCALQHGAYQETAAQVSETSKQYQNITGALIDDFRDWHGPSKSITPEEAKAIYDSLKSANPLLRLYVVRYTWQDQGELVPFAPYYDVINLWVWVAKEEAWGEEIDAKIEKIRQLTGKPIVLGLFLHDYGGTGKAIGMGVLEVQFRKATQFLRDGKIEGMVILQSGWFDQEDHRPQIQWMKHYLDWVFGTESTR